MTVGALWAECDNHVRPNSSDVLYNRPDCYRGIQLIHHPVAIAQDGDFTDAEDGCRCSQFHLSNTTDFNRIGVFALRTEAAPFPARGCDQVRFNAFRSVPGQRSTESERFVV